MHASTASLHACHCVRARMPGHGCTNPRASLHACHGIRARMPWPRCTNARRSCIHAAASLVDEKAEHPRRCALSSKNRQAAWQKRRFRVLPFKGRRCGRQPRTAAALPQKGGKTVMSGFKTTKSTLQRRARGLITGTQKHLANETLAFNGAKFTAPALIQLLQQLIDVITRSRRCKGRMEG